MTDVDRCLRISWPTIGSRSPARSHRSTERDAEPAPPTIAACRELERTPDVDGRKSDGSHHSLYGLRTQRPPLELVDAVELGQRALPAEAKSRYGIADDRI